jgi:hypothetical protein
MPYFISPSALLYVRVLGATILLIGVYLVSKKTLKK